MGLKTQRRRRRENKTDYKLRLNLLKSGMMRIVVRRTNRYFIVQIVASLEAQDKIIMSVTSKDLIKEGWDVKKIGSLKSIPAGYLTGKLLAKKFLLSTGDSKKSSDSIMDNKFIMDLGMARTLKGSRVFSVVKGLIDGGLKIPSNDKVFPDEKRLNGEHLNEEIKTIIVKIGGKL